MRLPGGGRGISRRHGTGHIYAGVYLPPHPMSANEHRTEKERKLNLSDDERKDEKRDTCANIRYLGSVRKPKLSYMEGCFALQRASKFITLDPTPACSRAPLSIAQQRPLHIAIRFASVCRLCTYVLRALPPSPPSKAGRPSFLEDGAKERSAKKHMGVLPYTCMHFCSYPKSCTFSPAGRRPPCVERAMCLSHVNVEYPLTPTYSSFPPPNRHCPQPSQHVLAVH